MDALGIIEFLGLKPHPEGGQYAEIWRETGPDGSRGACSAIYFLLRADERSHWHRVDAVEITRATCAPLHHPATTQGAP